MRKQNGITMVTLIITIIVMAILAGVVIVMTTGEDGSVNKSKESMAATEQAQAMEVVQTAWSALEMEFWADYDAGEISRNEFFTIDRLDAQVKKGGTGTITELNYNPEGQTIGWYEDDGKSFEFVIDTSKHGENVDEDSGDVTPGEEITTYTISFFNETGDNKYGTRTTVENGSVEFSNPGKAGYVFKYWATDPNGSNRASLSNITSSYSVYAYFEPAVYSVNFYNEDGSVKYGTHEVEYGGTAAYTNPSETGKVFKYWATDTSGVQKADLTNVQSSFNVYACFEKNTYTITYKSKTGGTTYYTETVEHGSNATYATKPTQTGYTFAHWATSANGSTKATLTNVSSNMTVYAYFTINTYSVKYYNMEGTSVYYTETVKYGGNAVYTGEPTRSGYTFMFWSTISGEASPAYLTNITSNVNVYAYFKVNSSVCFVAGTKVLTEYGLMNIEDITVGTKVYSYNEDTKEVELNKVLVTHKNLVDKDMTKVTINGQELESTSGHPYYTINRGWIPAKDLIKGERVLTSTGEELIIENVETKECTGKIYTTVYNLTVENNHNYYVGEDMVLVHNRLESPGMLSPC